MLEGDMELEDGQEALESFTFMDLCRIRMNHSDHAVELREACATIIKHLNGKLSIPPSECFKLLIYNGVVALCSTPEYERSR